MAARVSGHYGAVHTYPATPVGWEGWRGPMKGIGPYGGGAYGSGNPGGAGGLGTGRRERRPLRGWCVRIT